MIRCFIEGQEYNIVREPQVYISRSETENSATIVINTDSETNFDIYSKVLIEYGQNESFQFVIESVRPLKLAPDYFEHTITLVEPKSFFKTIYPSDRSFSRLLETGNPGILRPENLGEILSVYKIHLEAYHNVFIDFDDTDAVYQTPLPQKEYISRNFLEIVTDLFRRIEAIPRVEWQIEDNEVIWYITYERYAERNNVIDLSEFQSLSKEFDNIDFGSRMLAQAKNAVYENSPVVFPSKSGYVKARSETKVFQDSAAFVELDSNIFQLRKVVLKDIPIHLVNLEGNFAEPYGIRDIDISKYVVTKEEQDTFDEVGRDESVSEELSVRNTILYNFNNNRLFGFFTPNFETFFGFQANLNHLQNAINSYLKYDLPLLEPINLPEGTFYQLSPPGMHDYGDGVIDNTDLVTNDEGEVIKNARFNITYVPQRDIDFEIDRQDASRTTNTQVLNSQADSIVELGRYKQSIGGLINRLGTEQLQYKKIYAHNETLPKLGDYFGEYIITEINYTLFRKHIDVLFTLSKNFNNVKAEYAVSREPSPFTITGKTVNTNIITKTYVELSRAKKQDTDEFATQFGRNAILNMFDYDSQFQTEVEEAVFIPLDINWDQEYGINSAIHMPVMKSGNGGAMTFHFQFRNPQLAGFAQELKDADRFWQEDSLLKSGILYTDNNGYLPNYSLSIGQNLTVNDNYMYPLVDFQLPNQFKNSFEVIDYPLELDTNARYSHTHHVQPVTDDASHIIINENWTLLHPLVTGEAIQQLKFYRSNKPFSIFDHTIRAGDIEFFNNLILDRQAQSIVLDLEPSATDYWCITDANDNILLAFNFPPTNFRLFFNFIKFREKLGELVFEIFESEVTAKTVTTVTFTAATFKEESIATEVTNNVVASVTFEKDVAFPFESEATAKTAATVTFVEAQRVEVDGEFEATSKTKATATFTTDIALPFESEAIAKTTTSVTFTTAEPVNESTATEAITKTTVSVTFTVAEPVDENITTEATAKTKIEAVYNVEKPLETTATPTLSDVVSDTAGEINFTLTNNEVDDVKFAWEVRTGDLEAEIVASQDVTDMANYVAGPETYTVTNLTPGATYNVRGRALANGNYEISDWTLFESVTVALEQTEQPTFTITGLSDTELVVSIKNEDTEEATIKYELDNDNPQEFTVTISGGQSNTQNISNLDPNTTYILYATAQATGKSISEVSEVEFTTDLRQTEEPTLSNLTATSDSITFKITNNDSDLVYFEYVVREGSETGTIVEELRFDDQDNPLVQDDATFTVDNLNVSTTYYVTASAVAQTDASRSEITPAQNVTTTSGIKTWVVGVASAPFDVTVNQGQVTTCPTQAQQLQILEAAFPAANQEVGDSGVVSSFRDDSGNIQICPQTIFVVEE